MRGYNKKKKGLPESGFGGAVKQTLKQMRPAWLGEAASGVLGTLSAVGPVAGQRQLIFDRRL